MMTKAANNDSALSKEYLKVKQAELKENEWMNTFNKITEIEKFLICSDNEKKDKQQSHKAQSN